MFFVIKGRLLMKLRDKDLWLDEGEFGSAKQPKTGGGGAGQVWEGAWEEDGAYGKAGSSVVR